MVTEMLKWRRQCPSLVLHATTCPESRLFHPVISCIRVSLFLGGFSCSPRNTIATWSCSGWILAVHDGVLRTNVSFHGVSRRNLYKFTVQVCSLIHGCSEHQLIFFPNAWVLKDLIRASSKTKAGLGLGRGPPRPSELYKVQKVHIKHRWA